LWPYAPYYLYFKIVSLLDISSGPEYWKKKSDLKYSSRRVVRIISCIFDCYAKLWLSLNASRSSVGLPLKDISIIVIKVSMHFAHPKTLYVSLNHATKVLFRVTRIKWSKWQITCLYYSFFYISASVNLCYIFFIKIIGIALSNELTLISDHISASNNNKKWSKKNKINFSGSAIWNHI